MKLDALVKNRVVDLMGRQVEDSDLGGGEVRHAFKHVPPEFAVGGGVPFPSDLISPR